MEHVGYIRVSSVDQNEGRQLQGVELEKTFVDKCSGRDANRPALAECLDYLRAGDVLHVHSIDRLGRSMTDLMMLVERLTAAGVSVHFHKENLVFSAGATDAMQKLQFSMLAAFAEFERALIRERQKEGIAIAKAAGKYKGRKPLADASLAEKAREMLQTVRSKSEVAKALGVSRTTLYKVLSGK